MIFPQASNAFYRLYRHDTISKSIGTNIFIHPRKNLEELSILRELDTKHFHCFFLTLFSINTLSTENLIYICFGGIIIFTSKDSHQGNCHQEISKHVCQSHIIIYYMVGYLVP